MHQHINHINHLEPFEAVGATAERALIRLAQLQDVMAALGRALSPARVAEVVIEQGLHMLKVSAGSLVLLRDDGQTLDLVRSIGYATEIVKNWNSFPLASITPISDAVRLREAIWLDSVAARAVRYPHLAVAYPHEAEHSWVAVPLLANERVLGAIGLEFNEKRPFDQEELDHFMMLAQQAAHALERTRLYQETQEALQITDEALARLDMVLNTAPVGIALWDTNLRYVHINPMLATLNGIPPAAHIGRTLPEVMPRLAEVLQPVIEQVLESGEARNNIEFHARPSTSFTQHDWLLSFYPVRLASGRMVGVGALVLDITDRKRSEARQTLLTEITLALAETPTVNDVLTVMTSLVMPALDATAIWVSRLSDDRTMIEVITTVGYPEQDVTAWQHTPVDTVSPLADIVRTGEPLWIESQTEQLERYPHANTVDTAPAGTRVAIPMIVNGTAIGGICLSFIDYRHFAAEEREFIQAVVQQFAQAYERARLHEAEREAREQAERAADRTARLQTLTAALAGAMSIEQVGRLLVTQAILTLGAYAGSVMLLVDSGNTLELVYATGYQPALMLRGARIPMRTPLPMTDAIRTRNLVLVGSPAEWAARYPSYPLDDDNRQAVAVAVPLLLDARPIGGLVLSFNDERMFDLEDRSMLMTLAQQCAQACERARLYEAERAARAEAEMAVTIRDQFLSVAAHELKTPLTSLMGNTQLLERRLDRDGGMSERDRRSLQVVMSQSRRLNQMIEALLDVGRIEGGQLSIERVSCDLGQLLTRVVGEIQPTLSRHSALQRRQHGGCAGR